ncbi:hypothetical protein [Vibrio sp. TBV020]|uniref:hypothetical protein n=1 Tax=Vibrio sp. TBV020 TaxID=3137398 RepID=UPI0038CD0FDF
MKKYVIIASLFAYSAHADLVETIEQFTDIFGVSLSNVDGNTIYTLDATYDINDKLRVFGDIDTESSWEAGIGYSFWSGESYYTENTIKVSDIKYSTGIFAAKSIAEDWIAIGDINYNYMLDIDDPNCHWFDSCNGNRLEMVYLPSDTIDYSLGAMWSAHKYIDLMYKFNQEIGLFHNEISVLGEKYPLNKRTNTIYHEVMVFLNLKYIRPSVTYTVRDELENYVEFGLTFDF